MPAWRTRYYAWREFVDCQAAVYFPVLPYHLTSILHTFFQAFRSLNNRYLEREWLCVSCLLTRLYDDLTVCSIVPFAHYISSDVLARSSILASWFHWSLQTPYMYLLPYKGAADVFNSAFLGKLIFFGFFFFVWSRESWMSASLVCSRCVRGSSRNDSLLTSKAVQTLIVKKNNA